MPYDTAIALDQVLKTQLQHEVVVNGLMNAVATAGLFGVKMRQTQGLDLTLYGGNFPVDGTYVVIPDTRIRLTASATNYLYVTVGGVITKVTSAPAGWPGPLASSARALYQLTVGADAITSGTEYVIGAGFPGPAGATGSTGPAGAELWLQRKRIWEVATNQAAVTITLIGFAVTLTPTTYQTGVYDTSSFGSSTPSAQLNTLSGGVPGSSVQHYSQNFCYLGNAAGRGGFKVSIRWALTTTDTAAVNLRSFFGLMANGNFPITNVEPDTLTNIIGVCAKAGDANYSVIHNDGSGTATLIALGANFPARNVNRLYELMLESVANSGVVTYTITDPENANTATGSLSTNIPSNTTLLAWGQWMNNGTSVNNSGFNAIQVVGESRY